MSGYFTRVARLALDADPKLQAVTNRFIAPRAPATAKMAPDALLFDEHSGGEDAATELPPHRSQHAVRAGSALASEPPTAGDLDVRSAESTPSFAPMPGRTPRQPASPRRSTAPPGDSPAPDTAAAPAPGRRDETRTQLRLEQPAGGARLMPPAASPASRIDMRPPPADSAAPPSIHVHIGRIDVRAIQPPAPKVVPALRTPLRKPSLEAHLRARDRGSA